MIPRLCIAHKPPIISPSLYDAIIDTPPRANYRTLVSVVAQPVMASLAGESLIGVCGWRKIVIRGEASHGFMTRAKATEITRDQTEPRPGFDWLLCKHHFVEHGGRGGIRQQWSDAHHAQDWRDFMQHAVETHILTEEEVHALGEEPALIEGGFSMGVYPAKFLRETIFKINPLYLQYARCEGARIVQYDPVQRRCLAFMAERLETHFILKELRRCYPKGIPEEIFGTLVAVSDGPWIAGTMP